MKRKTIVELALVVGILTVLTAIGMRLLSPPPALTMEMDPNVPGLDQVRVTIAGRPHSIEALMNAPQTVRRRASFRYSTNSHGFRGPEYTIEKPPHTTRIVAVGECVTMGNGVDDDATWTALLDGALQERYPGLRYEVINLGIQRDPRNIFSLLLGHGVSLDPDLVIFSPGSETVFVPAHTGGEPFKSRLEPEEYDQLLGSYSDVLRGAFRSSQEHGYDLVFVTPTINSFFLPDGELWVEKVRQVGAELGIPVLDTAALFQQVERSEGLAVETEHGRQRLVAYESGQGRVLLEVEAPTDAAISTKIYSYLDRHEDIGPRLSIDGNHPNEAGHALIAKELLRTLEQADLLEQPDGDER